jgi:hypothetical protein
MVRLTVVVGDGLRSCIFGRNSVRDVSQDALCCGKAVERRRGVTRQRAATFWTEVRRSYATRREPASDGYLGGAFDKLGVTGSSPVPPTSRKPRKRGFFLSQVGHLRAP